MVPRVMSVLDALILLAFVVVTAVAQESGWGPWGEYSSCSTTCGVGVRIRTRRCLQSRCQGDPRQAESCQTQACPTGSVESRAYQCSLFNRDGNQWTSHYDMTSPCQLFCINQHGRLQKLRDSVIDGTTCDSHHSFGVCVAGVCKESGCDHVIGSTKTVDDCLVCGGRGENCETISGSSQDTAAPQVGKQNTVASFPFGATRLIIRATATWPEAIELHSGDGRVLNLTQYLYLTSNVVNRTIDFSGAKGLVQNQDSGFVLTARGPISQGLHLNVYPTDNGPNIQYEYSIPSSRLVEKDPEFRYSWVDGRWTDCSVTCGVGSQRRAVNCIDRTTGLTVSRELCRAEEIPELTKTCANIPCRQSVQERYKWIPGQFADCNTECGAGHQTQIMFCLKNNPDGESAYVQDVECEQNIGSKPVIQRACFGPESHCGRWVTGAWSQCSVTCGQGRQTRRLECEKVVVTDDEDNEITRTAEDESLCPEDSRPHVEQACRLAPCGDGRDDEIVIETLLHECQTTRYGCCPDQVTAASGVNYLGCEANCRESTYGCCGDGVTSARGPNRQGCPRWIGGCAGTRYGCCRDGLSAARGPNKEGCDGEGPLLGGCASTAYGCCADRVRAATGPNAQGCPESKNILIGGCRSTRHGCCPDGVTAATEAGCPAFDQAHCELEMDKGGCSNYSILFHFDTRYGRCRKFYYHGCGGNQNRFSTESECSRHCMDVEGQGVCRLPKSRGPCQSNVQRYFYNYRTQQCEMFTYGGCYGNTNNFQTIEECQTKCHGGYTPRPTVRTTLLPSHEPKFDMTMTSVTVKENSTAVLPCSVSSLGRHQVVWTDHVGTLLMYEDRRNVDDERLSVKRTHQRDWNLHIRDVRYSDQGMYNCQITTNPVKIKTINLIVESSRLACASVPCHHGFSCQDYRNGSYSCSCNPDWGKNCEAPPGYWCFSDSECSHGLKCVRQRKCQNGYCWIYARCSAASKAVKCDRKACPRGQECVVDDSFDDGHFCVNPIPYRRTSRVVIGCRLSEFGCCSDQRSAATGPNYQGCPRNCLNTKYGCCRDGTTPADGPGYLGCEVEGSGEVPCEKTVYGCCEDGVTPAEGPRSRGCGDTPDSEDRNHTPVTKPAKVERCTAAYTQIKCKDQVAKWRYNTAKKDCEQHWWGGCEDNGNVFDTRVQCEDTCKHKIVVIPETADPDDIVNLCDLPSEPGPCRGKIRRYYYNPREQRCSSFTYGGCQGNENNFDSLEGCQRKCMEISVTPRPDILVPETRPLTMSVSGESSVKQGGYIRISCSASGPKKVVLKWYYNNIPASNIRNAQHSGRSSETTTGYNQVAELYIPNAQVNNTGTYACRSSTGEVERMVVTVQPYQDQGTGTSSESTDSEVSLHGESSVEVGSTIRLTCRACGPRRPSEIQWYFNGRPIVPETGSSSINTYPSSRDRNQLTSELRIDNVQIRNEGTYYCRSNPNYGIKQLKVSVRQRTAQQPDTAVSESGSNSTDKAVVCKLEAVTGNCRASMQRWYYDHREGSCRQFVYGGCGGNSNNFHSQEECNDFCSAEEMCLKPVITGRCRASIPRFFFDYQIGKCKNFIYGGCGGNLNNFESYRACETRCAPYRRRVVGTEVVVIGAKEPTAGQDVCSLRYDMGQCPDQRDKIVMWYFAPSLNRCLRFWYSGCAGNGNRFEKEAVCLTRCSPTPATLPLPQTSAPVSDRSACAQPENAGECDNWMLIWYYDMSRKICHQFYYGGCGGNSNRFSDRASCESLCISDITARPEITTERPSQCAYTTFGCCADGISRALDRQKSNCYESNVVVPQPSRDHTVILVSRESDALLTCRLRGSELVWYRDSFLLSSTRKTEIYTNGSLVLRKVTTDMAGIYSCRVLDRNNVARLERFKVELTDPVDIRAGPALMSFRPGSRAYLNCHATGNPQPTITWQRNGRVISGNHRHAVHRNGTLIIDDIRVEDAGNYECLADNGMHTRKTKTILLNIKEGINARIASHKGIYQEGETIQLSCSGSGHPAPDLEWVKEDRTLVSENNTQVNAGELRIKSATVEDSGMYKCIARNNRNRAEDITTVQIKLQGPMVQCQEKLSRTKCMTIVKAHLCGIRHYYNSCCESCERARRPR